MSKFIRIIEIFSLMLLLILMGCKKKESLDFPIEKIQIENGSILRSVYFINDSIGFICGGKRNIEGYIYKTTDGGSTWSKTVAPLPRCLYDVYFIDDSIGFAGGDFLNLLTTSNGGTTWTSFPYSNAELPYHEQNRPAIKEFSFASPLEGYFVGGENYNKGVLYNTLDGGLSWSFDTTHQEIMSVNSFAGTTWASGFGYIAKSNNGDNFEQLKLKNDVFTSIQQLSDNSVIVISNTGAIYKSTDNGNNWTTIRKKNKLFSKQIALNGLDFSNNQGIIVGANGTILYSKDYGDSWKTVTTDSIDTLNTIYILNNKAYIVSEGGDLLILELS